VAKAQPISKERNGEMRLGIKCTHDSYAELTIYEAKDEKYVSIFSCTAMIGKNGPVKHAEGDTKTPLGTWIIGEAYGIADDPGSKMPYLKVNNSIWWNCDSNSKEYNSMVNTDYYKEEFSHKDSEHIIDYTKAYAYAMNINYNAERKGGKGCAIFLHCFTDNDFTEGCVAIPEKEMKKVSDRMIEISNLFKKLYKDLIIH